MVLRLGDYGLLRAVHREVLGPVVHQRFPTFWSHSAQFGEEESLGGFPDLQALMLPSSSHHLDLETLEGLAAAQSCHFVREEDTVESG